jgi:hypothetical protein
LLSDRNEVDESSRAAGEFPTQLANGGGLNAAKRPNHLEMGAMGDDKIAPGRSIQLKC